MLKIYKVIITTWEEIDGSTTRPRKHAAEKTAVSKDVLIEDLEANIPLSNNDHVSIFRIGDNTLYRIMSDDLQHYDQSVVNIHIETRLVN